MKKNKEEIRLTCNQMLDAMKSSNYKLWSELLIKLKKLSKLYEL